MSFYKRNGHWFIALAGIGSLAYSLGLQQARLPELPAAVAAIPAVNSAGLAEARGLSSAFRDAAKSALPAIVSIETRGKSMPVSGTEGMSEDSFEGTPLGELFRRDPGMRDLFRRGVPQRRTPQQGMGSGFIIEESGIILTNNHVVADAETVKVRLHDGREFVASDIKTDPRTDVAILRIHADGKLPVLRMGNSDAVDIGDWVLAIGSPFGLDATVTAGIISAKGRGMHITEREDFLQTDAAINPGNSGGPLVNLNGEVIGINTAISTRSGGYDGVGFAVPINLAHWVAEQLIQKGTVSRAYLGVAIQPVDNELSKQFGVPVGKGALITDVRPDTPAAAAKLEAGDLILQFNGKDIHGPRDLQSVVERLKVGSKYPMQIVRDGKEMVVDVTAQEMPRNYSLASDSLGSQNRGLPEAPKAESYAEIGVEIEALKPEVLQKLGYQADVSGVLVTDVKPDSPAAAVGIREGMVIAKVGSRRVNSPADFKEALKSVSLDRGILVLVRTPRGGNHVVIRKDGK
ncbi:MAG: Do family serine endopeptidase [Planctomycetes bacterium]|nr:Do family serine endopeptidase [Planctomycetota bacterium]